MVHVWEDGDGRPPARKRKKRKRRRRRRESDGLGEHESPGYGAAVELAERKLAFVRDAVQFGFWTGLALVFIFPLGVILLITGGPKRFRRFSELYLEPRARERLTRNELRKRAGPRRQPHPADDLPTSRPVAYDRAALEELERSVSQKRGGGAGLQLAELDMAELVDSALASLSDRIARDGVTLERRLDAGGTLRGDADELKQALVHVLANALETLARTETREPRIDIEMGENLAGSAVWIRIRDNGPEAGRADLASAERVVDAHGGHVERVSDAAGDVEVLITLPRRPAAKQK